MALVVLTGCGGRHKTGAHNGGHETSREKTFRLVAAVQPLAVAVPSQPLGSTPTTIPGVDLRLYVVRRLSANAAVVVFSLYTKPGASNINPIAAMNGVSSNGFAAQGASVSDASLVDLNGLKQYLTYMSDPTKDSTCVCSYLPNSDATFVPGKAAYFAAVTAAPPPGVTTVSFVIGLGTVAGVPLSG